MRTIDTIPELQEMARVARWLAERGWAEANAGNCSVRLSRTRDDLLSPDAASGGGPSTGRHSADSPSRGGRASGGGAGGKMPVPAPDLAGDVLLITGSLRRMRDVAVAPEENVALIRILPAGEGYLHLWGASPVTSEFPAHAAIHAVLKRAKPSLRAVLHTHPTHLIALTHLPAYADKPDVVLDRLLRLHPETRFHLPAGVGSIPYRIPGSLELGEATAQALEEFDIVLWKKHGVVAVAESLSRAFDRVEVLAKAAEIYLAVLAAGQDPTLIEGDQMALTREAYRRRARGEVTERTDSNR